MTETGPVPPLLATDLLGSAELTPGVGVRFGRPLVYPVGPAGSFGVLVAVDVAWSARPSSVWFELSFDDRGVVAERVHPDGDALGLVYGRSATGTVEVAAASTVAAAAIAAARDRPDWLVRLAHRSGTVRSLVTGTGGHRIRWVYNDPTGRLQFPSTFAMHAVVTGPNDPTGLTGRLRVGVDRARSAGVAFTGTSAASAAFDRPAIKLCLGLRGTVSPLLSRGAEQIDQEWFTFPVGVDERALVASLLNDVTGSGATLLLHRAPGGRPGAALRRVLDAVPPPTDGVRWVLPEVVFQDVVARSGGRLSTEDFDEVTLTDPVTGLQQQIWLHVPPS